MYRYIPVAKKSIVIQSSKCRFNKSFLRHRIYLWGEGGGGILFIYVHLSLYSWWYLCFLSLVFRSMTQSLIPVHPVVVLVTTSCSPTPQTVTSSTIRGSLLAVCLPSLTHSAPSSRDTAKQTASNVSLDH